LAATARLALARNNPERAARLLGAAEALADALDVPLLVPPPSQLRRLVSTIQSKLGADRFAGARNAGRSLSIDEAAEASDLGDIEPATVPANLSARELDVLRLLATGIRDQEIADALFISVRTVEGHVARLLAKLGASSRTAAVRSAIALGIVDLD
jgi:non-specific serine/threonine protein kinase